MVYLIFSNNHRIIIPHLKSCYFLFPVPLGGVTNLQVTNPTHTTLTASWDAADGNVQGYKVIYTPVAGGLEIIVSILLYC